jgi:predicted enzyme related to lactoylglutathione lyase
MSHESTSLEFRFFYFTTKYDDVVAFYRDGLDLDIVNAWDGGPENRGTVFRSPNGTGMIEVEAGSEGPPTRGGLYIEVDNVDAWYKKAENKGINIKRASENTSYGHRSFRIVDPGGLEIGIFSKIGT